MGQNHSNENHNNRNSDDGPAPEFAVMSGKKVTIKITYCRNWDGGRQEFSTAREAVLAVLPDAEIIENRVDEWPIEVKVVWITHDNDTNETVERLIWKGSQRDLFRKYPRQRSESIVHIKMAVSKLFS